MTKLTKLSTTWALTVRSVSFLPFTIKYEGKLKGTKIDVK